MIDTTKLYPKKKTSTNRKDKIAFKRFVMRSKNCRVQSLCVMQISGMKKNKCESKCNDCKWAQRNMREGRFQDIFKHWTIDV